MTATNAQLAQLLDNRESDETVLTHCLEQGSRRALAALAGHEAHAATLLDAELNLAAYHYWQRKGVAHDVNPYRETAAESLRTLGEIAAGNVTSVDSPSSADSAADLVSEDSALTSNLMA